MKRPHKPFLFLISAIVGIVVSAIIIGLTLYQYVNLSLLIQTSPLYGVTLGQSLINSEETNYLIIILATAPLLVLSFVLLTRSLARLKKARQKARL